MLNPLYIWGINTTWSCIILLTYYWIQYANILLKMFTSMFMREVLCSFLCCEVSILFLYQDNIGSKNVLGHVPSHVLS